MAGCLKSRTSSHRLPDQLKKPGQSDLEAVEEIMRAAGNHPALRIKPMILSQMARASKNDQAKSFTGATRMGADRRELAHSEIELYRTRGRTTMRPLP